MMHAIFAAVAVRALRISAPVTLLRTGQQPFLSAPGNSLQLRLDATAQMRTAAFERDVHTKRDVHSSFLGLDAAVQMCTAALQCEPIPTRRPEALAQK